MCEKTNPKKSCTVVENIQIAKDIFEMKIDLGDLTNKIQPGQFINLYCKSYAHLLPRPISICEVNNEEQWIKIVYARVGSGTAEFSMIRSGEQVEIMGPLGNGFSLEKTNTHLLIGGGVGTPPLLELAKQLPGKKTIVLGFRTEPYLVEAFKSYGDVWVATDDGSVGFHGNVIDLINKEQLYCDSVYACGPKPMLKAIQNWTNEKGIPAQLSLEERMGCGFGACVGCVCKVKADNEYGYTYKKVCKDGPVFNSKEVMFE